MTPIARIVATVLALGWGCGFDESGFGSGGSGVGSTAADGSSTSTSTEIATTSSSGGGEGEGETTTAAATTTPVTTGEPHSTESSSGLDGHELGTDSTTEPLDPCDVAPPFTMSMDADLATLSGTMMLGMLGGGEPYVYSIEADTGSASFTFDLACPSDVRVWARIYDADPFLLDLLDNGSGADRMRVEVDGMPTDWRYGCQSGTSEWSWQTVSTNDFLCTGATQVVHALAPGEHTITFVPTEAGAAAVDGPGDAAALMAVFVTDDPAQQP